MRLSLSVTQTTPPSCARWVKEGTLIITGLWYIPGTGLHAVLNTYTSGNTFYTVTVDTPLGRLCQQAQELETAHLGHKPDAIGRYSIRSAAMAMILSSVPNYMVLLLIGWWKLDAFLTHVSKQVAEFTKLVSQKMITRPLFPIHRRILRETTPMCSLLTRQWQDRNKHTLWLTDHKGTSHKMTMAGEAQRVNTTAAKGTQRGERNHTT